MKLVYSRDDEEFNIDVLGDLLISMNDDGCLSVGEIYFVAEAVDAEHRSYIDVNSVLESFDERAADELGECYNNDFSCASSAAKQELQDAIVSWAEKHTTLPYWVITGKSRQLTVTQDDIESTK